MELFLTISPEEIEEEIQKGRIQRAPGQRLEISIQNKTELFLEEKLLAVVEIDGEKVFWNPAKEKDPRITGNENAGGKSGFRFSPYFHPKGKFLQDVIKLGMIKAIATAHKQINRGYDQDAFKYEDPRLQQLNTFFQIFISENFGDAKTGPRKLIFMFQMADIVLFLMKEDIYYRTRFLKMFNEVPGSWQLTEEEEKNLIKWN